ncbi:putative ubiquitin carboxyl-terminal hydrolase [Myxozyma melibiosi]|uniref:Ubiquitin carboxyl-terminal hydrolase n=1 Tax=Myxozyma melibiosi TaxID=54550 RepID=A0ABR1FD62_9ASCO
MSFLKWMTSSSPASNTSSTPNEKPGILSRRSSAAPSQNSQIPRSELQRNESVPNSYPNRAPEAPYFPRQPAAGSISSRTSSPSASQIKLEFTRLDGSDKLFGIENFGNTCYCNSILQCLFFSKPFREFVLNYPSHSSVIRSPRRTVNGKTPHPFIAIAEKEKNASAQNLATANGGVTTPSSAKSTFMGSYFMFGMSSSPSSANSFKDSPGSNSSGNGSPAPKLSRSSSLRLPTDMLKASRKTSTIPIVKEEAGKPVSSSPNPFAPSSVPNAGSGANSLAENQQKQNGNGEEELTPEQKKRQAMVNGPIINMDHSLASSYGMEESLFSALKDLFEAVVENKSGGGVTSPAKLIEVLKKKNELFRSTMHQDAHEFFNFLLNEVIETITDYDKKLIQANKTAVGKKTMQDLFEGILSSETKCLTCETASTRDEPFIDLSIDIEENRSVSACLQQFSASELLCQNNKFHCDSCGGLQEAERRVKIKRAPKILALHLKRFKFTEDMQRNVKLLHRVVFPFHVRLFNNTTDEMVGAQDADTLYELYAVIVHVGGGPYHGHYVAIVKTDTAGWVLFDDEMVERVDESFVHNFFGDKPGMATAYILFYQAITEDEYTASRSG